MLTASINQTNEQTPRSDKNENDAKHAIQQKLSEWIANFVDLQFQRDNKYQTKNAI